jgi:hypothetical protein
MAQACVLACRCVYCACLLLRALLPICICLCLPPPLPPCSPLSDAVVWCFFPLWELLPLLGGLAGCPHCVRRGIATDSGYETFLCARTLLLSAFPLNIDDRSARVCMGV